MSPFGRHDSGKRNGEFVRTIIREHNNLGRSKQENPRQALARSRTGVLGVISEERMLKAVAVLGMVWFGVSPLVAAEPNIRVDGAWMRAVPPSVSDTRDLLDDQPIWERTRLPLTGGKTLIADSVDR